MENGADELKVFLKERGISVETISAAVGCEQSTVYRKIKKGRTAFTVGMVRRMVDSKVMSRDDAVRIFLS